jgi:hypothetical protein
MENRKEKKKRNRVEKKQEKTKKKRGRDAAEYKVRPYRQSYIRIEDIWRLDMQSYPLY